MALSGPGQQLSIYVDESDLWHHRPLYLALLEAARKAGIAGATVLRGIAGYGAHSRVHTEHLLDLSSNLPVIVQIVDAPAKIAAFLPVVESMVSEGLVTLTDLTVHLYRHRGS